MLRKKDFIKLINLKNSFPRWGTWPVGLDGAPAGSDLLDKKKPPGAQITFIHRMKYISSILVVMYIVHCTSSNEIETNQ